jgi:integrase
MRHEISNMARELNRLTARRVQTLKEPGRHSDGGGLYLSIDAQGRRRWVFMYTRDGKRTELGLGGGRDISLADARFEAARLRSILIEGGDPKAKRHSAAAPAVTFGTFADELIDQLEHGFRNAKHRAQWRSTLKAHAAPLQNKAIADISTDHVLSVLQPIWTTIPETASRVRGRIERVLDAAKAKGLREGENPARWRGHLDALLSRRKPLSRGHHSALPYDELPGFLAMLRSRPAVAAVALELAILTAARTGEVLGARWEEFDLGKAIWIVPAVRMKAGREHRVPLSRSAIALLEGLGGAQRGLVFRGTKADQPMSNMAMAMLLRRMGRGDLTVHGFRSTFRDWAAETTEFPAELCEMALAHVIGSKVEAAYRRGDMFEKRRVLMEAWGSFCRTAVLKPLD